VDLVGREWDRGALRARAEHFSEAAFVTRMTSVLREHGAV